MITKSYTLKANLALIQKWENQWIQSRKTSKHT